VTESYLRKFFPAGTEIFRSGDLGDCAYVIDEGEVEIAIPLGAKRPAFNRLGPGQLFGEMALIDGSKRMGSARAVTDTLTRVITASQILDRLHGSDDIVAFVLRITLMRYRHLLHQIQQDELGTGTAAADLAQEELLLPDSKRVVAKLELENELREALENRQFELYYQPLVVLAEGRLAGFEALMRWHSPRLGFVAPGVFIPLAEETGLITPICRWALTSATRALAGFQEAAKSLRANGALLTVSVNVTKHQIGDAETMAVIDRIPADTGVDRGQLKLELTESALMSDSARTQDWIAQLKRRRIKVSIDDFGTGYSSLGYLHQFGVDELKIDRSFVEGMLNETRSMEIVRAIIGLAQGLGLGTVAEGIEQGDQARRLEAAGCELGQGYLFGRPAAAEDTLRRIRTDGFAFVG
jgi:EAL domain-containing protein (putative c-di-GMP-specific phosphodiesterase class I)/CRP-like cAMP-binding protein